MCNLAIVHVLVNFMYAWNYRDNCDELHYRDYSISIITHAALHVVVIMCVNL